MKEFAKKTCALAEKVGGNVYSVNSVLKMHDIKGDNPMAEGIVRGELMEDKTELVLDLPRFANVSKIAEILMVRMVDVKKMIEALGWSLDIIGKESSKRMYIMTAERWKQLCDFELETEVQR